MKKEKTGEMNVPIDLIEPVVDSQNPPIGVDMVLLANTPFGVRMCGFSGSPFALSERIVEMNGQKHRVINVRPVCVVDLSQGAMNALLPLSLDILANEDGRFELILKMYPELKAKLKEKLPEITKMLEA